MGCLFFILGLAAPRLVVFLLWFFTNWFDGMFHSFLIPILGFLFLPYTLLWYTVVINWYHGVWGFWQIAIMVLALLTDLSASGGSARKSKKHFS